MSRVGVFIGSAPLEAQGQPACDDIDTPWGRASAIPVCYEYGEHELLLMPRHGAAHEFAPHQINYRANVWLMQSLGVNALIGTHAVGSIDPALPVGGLVLPDQIIDYTWGREGSYDDTVRHIDFSYPFDEALRASLLAASAEIIAGGTYACTQGPRLETIAEVKRLAQDGADLVGMTNMPEAALARELDLAYVSLCLVVNPAAGVAGDEVVDMDALFATAKAGAEKMLAVLLHWLTER